MKIKKKKHRNKPKRRRNSASGGASLAGIRGLRMPRIRRGAPPPWQTIGAAVAGSVGSAIASGLIVNQKIAKPETISLLMAATGGLGAYLTDGNARVAFTGVAAAGAGQYALAALGKAAMRKEAERQQTQTPAQGQLPAPAPAPPAPRQRATGGGAVVELFRDAAADLESIDEDDDGDRYSTRNEHVDDDTPLEIDLDEAA